MSMMFLPKPFFSFSPFILGRSIRRPARPMENSPASSAALRSFLLFRPRTSALNSRISMTALAISTDTRKIFSFSTSAQWSRNFSATNLTVNGSDNATAALNSTTTI
jgi:hypothetical protein